MLPGPTPGGPDRRVAVAPFLLEGVELKERQIGVVRPIDRLQVGHDQLAVFPRHEGQRIADQMHDAGLDDRFGKRGGNRFRKAFEPVDDSYQDILNAAVF